MVWAVGAVRASSPDKGTQELGQPAQEQAEVVAGSGEHGVDAIALGALEIVTAHAVLGLEMADDRLDGGSAAHLAPDRGSDPADLPGDPDPELVGMIVAAYPLSTWMRAGLHAGELLQIGDDGPRGCGHHTGYREVPWHGGRTVRPWVR